MYPQIIYNGYTLFLKYDANRGSVMKYTNLLFDLDNTIFNTTENATRALHNMKVAQTFDFNEDKMQWWFQVNDLLWGQFEAGDISRAQLLDLRFKTFFGHYDINVNSEQSAKYEVEFQALFAAEHELMPNALNMLEKVSTDHHLFVVTNGSKKKQITQLAGANINKYFDQIFLSEDIGFKKPDVEFFDVVESEIPGATTSNMLVIGDSLTADIDGANRSKIDSVWYNPGLIGNDGEILPTFTVNDFNILTKLVLTDN